MSNYYPVIIAGSRTFHDEERLFERCNFLCSTLTPNIIVISGGAAGADTLGERWARGHGYNLQRFPADWNLHGRSAGPIRNRYMAEFAVNWARLQNTKPCLIAFLGEASRGTLSMLQIARELHMHIRTVKI